MSTNQPPNIKLEHAAAKAAGSAAHSAALFRQAAPPPPFPQLLPAVNPAKKLAF